MTSQTPMPDSSATEPEPTRLEKIKPLLILLLVAIALVAFKPEWARAAAIFIPALSFLVFVHEWGHFQFARWAGMKVNRFAIGFPPFIYTKRKNNVDYSIGALPIGGLVDIAGLGSEEEMVASAKGEAVSTPHRDPSRPFGQKQFQDGSLFARFMVLFAGPMMNFIVAMIIFIGVYTTVGIPNGGTIKGIVASVFPNTPAVASGLQAGDEITKVGAKSTPQVEDVVKAIRANGLKATTITVLRNGQNQTFSITPVARDLHGDGKIQPSVGIEFDQTDRAIQSLTYKKVGPIEAVKYGFTEAAMTSLKILDMVKRALTAKLLPQEIRDIGGPVKIAKTMDQIAPLGMVAMLRMIALLSVNLGVMNLLPVPALDGGRIMFLGFELVLRRPVPPRIEGIVHAAGMVMLLGFMILITLKDVGAGILLERFAK